MLIMLLLLIIVNKYIRIYWCVDANVIFSSIDEQQMNTGNKWKFDAEHICYNLQEKLSVCCFLQFWHWFYLICTVWSFTAYRHQHYCWSIYIYKVYCVTGTHAHHTRLLLLVMTFILLIIIIIIMNCCCSYSVYKNRMFSNCACRLIQIWHI